MHSEFYRKLKDKSIAISSRWREVVNQSWIDYYGFSATPISQEIWMQETQLCALNEEFHIDKIGVILLPPYFNYNWHVDTNRGCAINMLLSHGKSHTFFATPSPDDHQVPLGSNGHFVELNYEPDTFYAFNTQRLHCVYNFEKPRYLFSCEFYERKDELSYERLCEWIEQQ